MTKRLHFILLMLVGLILPAVARASEPTEPYAFTHVVDIDEDATRSVLLATESAQTASQIVLVQDSVCSFWELDSCTWRLTFATKCGFGRKGFASASRKVEGDRKTPTGEYTLTTPFGIASDPGSCMGYRQVTDNSYWSGEREDYNTWVEVEPGTRDMRHSEHLIDYTVSYQYGFFIDYNSDPAVYGRGSAIFLHCKDTNKWSTAGCIALTSEHTRYLMRNCRPGTRIVIKSASVPEE